MKIKEVIGKRFLNKELLKDNKTCKTIIMTKTHKYQFN